MNEDELLEQMLERMESGESAETVVSSLPPAMGEMRELLHLAETARQVEPPQFDDLKARSQYSDLQAAGARGRSGLRLPGWAASSSIILLVATLLVLVGMTGVVFSKVSAAARTATLSNVGGVVEAADPSAPDQWRIVNSGDHLTEGALVRTRADSAATLVLFDGSRTTLSPGSEVELKHLNGSWSPLVGNSLQVQFLQITGQTHHSVVPLKGDSSYYAVFTPFGTATVHGTIFDVNVAADGAARYAVTRGVVAVNQVTLTAGQATYSQANGQILAPSYEFFVQGPISDITGNVWTVGGLSFTVDPSALGGFTFQVGDGVNVRGRILSDQSLVADEVTPGPKDPIHLRYLGKVESIGEQSWTISGKVFTVNADTHITPNLKVGDAVQVVFLVQDGTWLARRIAPVDEDLEAEPTSTSTPTATPTGTLTPTSTPTITGTPGPRAGCDGTMQQPEGQRLAQVWGVSYQEIMGWFCQGFGFGEIDLAYQLQHDTGTPVAQLFAMKASGEGWGQIESQVGKPERKPTNTPKPPKTDSNNSNGGSGSNSGSNSSSGSGSNSNSNSNPSK